MASSLLDEVAGPAQPNSTPAATAAAPAQGGSLLDQVAREGTPASQVTPPVASTPQPESMVDRWKREAYETVGKILPQATTGPTMQKVKHYAIDNFERAAQEGGKIAEQSVGNFFGKWDAEEAEANGEATPAYAKGLETQYYRQKAEQEHPIATGVIGGLANLGGQIVADPRNWPFLAKSIASKVGAVEAADLEPWAEKMMSKGFGIQMTSGVVDQIKDLASNWADMSVYDRSKAFTQILAGSYLSQSALREGFKGEEKPTTVGPEAGGQGPKKATQTGTEAGEKTLLRPTTRTTAGVEAPVSARAAATLEGEKPSLVYRAADLMTSPLAEQELGKQQTRPAATRQAQSTLGQVAEDRIGQHQAVVNGENSPEPITGTQQVSRFTTPDDAWQEMQKTAQDTTFKTADTISQREQEAWAAKRDEALKEYKDLVDRHNANIDDYNAQVPKDQQMQHAVMDPTEVAVPERPQSYNELRADIQKEQANAKSQDAAVREEAMKNGLPKAEKAMDNWFKTHADEISPAEYESVKRLWADSERFKEIAMKIRGPLTQGNLSGNAMRQIEVSMNNQQLRRGQAPDAFQRLLGPDGYNNWQNVAKLFDTVKDPSLPEQFKSWGKYASEYIASALIPHITGLGVAAKWGVEKLLNHVMFDPEFGSTFGRVVDWLKSRQGVVAQSIKELPATLRDKMVSIIKSYQDAGERGAVGAGVKQGSEPQPEKFGRKGLGGQPTVQDIQAASAPSLLDQVHEEHAPIRDTAPPNPLPDATIKTEDGITSINHPDGALQMTVKDGVAQVKGIYGSKPGMGQRLYDTAIQHAESVGAKEFRSDEVRTSDAEDAWQRLSTRYDVKRNADGTYSIPLNPAPETLPEAKPATADVSKIGPSETEGTVRGALQEIDDKFPINPENKGAGTVPKEYAVLKDGKPEATFTVSERGGKLRLKGIQSIDPRTGAGSRALKALTDIADTHNIPMELTASPYGDETVRLNGDQLKDWYARHGFIPEAGTDPSLGYMVREPKPLVETLPEARPATAVTDEYKQSLGANEIATTRPSAVGADNTNNPDRTSGIKTLAEATPKMRETTAQSIANYKDSGLKLTPDELEDPASYQDSIIKKAVSHYKNNLVALYNAIPESIRGISKQWYESAHDLSKKFSEQYGVSHPQAAAVIAALSPNNPWDNNVGMAQRLMKTWEEDTGRIWDEKMDEKLSSIRNAKSTKPEFRAYLDSIRGKSYNDLQGETEAETAAMKGLWLRMVDQSYGSPEIPVYAPDGTIRGSQKIAWGPYDAVAKAVKILDDGDIETINHLMGNGHKIRNFYNNIINPWSDRGHVTIDTHAVGAAHWKPFSQKDTEVAHNFGGSTPGIPGAGKHAGTGLAGTYPIYDEAYKQAAKEVGVSPRELQSITWEGIRSLFSGAKKTPELRKAVSEIWAKVGEGKMTPEAARQAIIERSGGFKRPVWTTDNQWNGAQEQPQNPSVAKGLNQTISLGEGANSISADVNPTTLNPELKGQPKPKLIRNPSGHLPMAQLHDLAAWFNANVEPKDILASTAHEIAHEFTQHHYGLPMENSSINLGHSAVSRGISGGYLNTGPGWNDRYQTAKTIGGDAMSSFLDDYSSHVMAGRAIEEMLGESPAKVKEHASGDVATLKPILRAAGIHPYLMDKYIDAATDRAKEVLRDKWAAVRHMTAQAVQHYGGKIDSATLQKYREGGTYQK